MTFLIADGVMPSNEWRGYVLRKIMRRAMRHGKRLGISEPFLHRLVDVARRARWAPPIRSCGRIATPSCTSSRRRRTLRRRADRRPAALEECSNAPRASPAGRVPGDEAFRLYDSLGMPVDFIEDLAGERQLTLDRAGYERAMEGQREHARASSAFEQKKADRFTFAWTPRGRARATPTTLRGLRPTTASPTPDPGALRRVAAAGRRAGRRATAASS